MLNSKENIIKIVDLKRYQTITAEAVLTQIGAGVDVELQGKNQYL
jgi:hypothetical protein